MNIPSHKILENDRTQVNILCLLFYVLRHPLEEIDASVWEHSIPAKNYTLDSFSN